MLGLAAFLLLSPIQSAVPDDEVVLKNGQHVKGKVTEFEADVAVQPATGKEQRYKRDDIAEIIYARVMIKFPLAGEFKAGDLNVGRAIVMASNDRLIVINGLMQGPIFIVDPANPDAAVKIDVGRLIGNVLAADGRLSFMEFKSVVDENQKFKNGEFEENKTVQTLTLHVYDLATAKEIRAVAFDNNDRKDLIWKYQETQVFQHRVDKMFVVVAGKSGKPLDAKHVLLQEDRFYATFHYVDPESDKKPTGLDVESLVPTAGAVFVSGTYLDFLPPPTRLLRAVDPKLKKPKYEWPMRHDETFVGRSGALAVTHTNDFLSAYSFKTGKVQQGYPVGMKSQLVDIRDDFIVVRRTDLTPPAFLYLDPESGREKVRVAAGGGAGYTYRGHIKKFELFCDVDGTPMAFDVLAKKMAWRTPLPSPAVNPPMLLAGTTLYYLNQGSSRIYALDLYTGALLWQHPSAAHTLIAAGARSLVEVTQDKINLISDAQPAKGTKFFNANGTPLSDAAGRAFFTAPAVVGDSLVTLDATGALWVLKPDESKVESETRALDWKPAERAPPRPVGTKVLIHSTQTGVLFDPATKKTTFSETSYADDASNPLSVEGGIWYIRGAASVKAYNIDAAKAEWESPIAGPVHDSMRAGANLWVLGNGILYRLEAATGRNLEERRVDPLLADLALDADGGLYLSNRGHELRKLHAKKDATAWTYKAKTDRLAPGVDWRGWIMTMPDLVLYASADREIVALKSADGTVAWRFETPEWPGFPLTDKGRVYLSLKGRGLLALDAATGKVAWESPARDAGNFTPMLWKDQAYFWSADGYMVPAF